MLYNDVHTVYSKVIKNWKRQFEKQKFEIFLRNISTMNNNGTV